MPVMIKVTTKEGETLINASLILAVGVNENGKTYIVVAVAGSIPMWVKETPDEIMQRIEKARTLETETTVYTDDRFTPHFYTD